MTISWRVLVAIGIVWFALNGKVQFFNLDDITSAGERPSDQAVKWVSGVRANAMTPADRVYLSSFYDAIAFVLERDGKRPDPVILTNEKFATLHGDSLGFAIDAEKVGQYPNLGMEIDSVFFAAAGDAEQAMTPSLRSTLVEACRALAWKFRINGED